MRHLEHAAGHRNFAKLDSHDRTSHQYHDVASAEKNTSSSQNPTPPKPPRQNASKVVPAFPVDTATAGKSKMYNTPRRTPSEIDKETTWTHEARSHFSNVPTKAELRRMRPMLPHDEELLDPESHPFRSPARSSETLECNIHHQHALILVSIRSALTANLRQV